VFFDCGTSATCAQQSNGVGFYYSDNFSWGFARGGDPLNRDECDFDDADPSTSPFRMCVHTYADQTVQPGYRCGTNIISDTSFARVAYKTTSALPSAKAPAPSR
jgi:hypothetical protein